MHAIFEIDSTKSKMVLCNKAHPIDLVGQESAREPCVVFVFASKNMFHDLAASGISSCLAETVTMPIDVVKTRMQMPDSKFKSGIDAAATIYAEDGPTALLKGIGPALARQASYGSMRFGLNPSFKAMMAGLLGVQAGAPLPLLAQIGAAIGSGAVASFITNPLDLAKVRMQADKKGELKGKSLFQVITMIGNNEGVLGLWTGVGATCARAAFLTAGEKVTKDEATRLLLESGLVSEGFFLVFYSALCAGFVGVLASNPFDVAKSRTMGQPVDPITGKGKLYSGMIDCFEKSVAAEGIGALYQGFWPNYFRKGPHVTVVFLCMAQLESLTTLYGEWVLYLGIALLAVFYGFITGVEQAGDKTKKTN